MGESSNPGLEPLQTRDFQRCLRALKRQGGVVSTAVHKQVLATLEAWSRTEGSTSVTRSALPGVAHACVHDLDGGYQLVVYEHAGLRIPLTVGTREEVAVWGRGNAGRDFTVNEASQRVRYTPAGIDPATTHAVVSGTDPVPAARGPLLARIPSELLAPLELHPDTLQALWGEATFEKLDDDDEGTWTERFGLLAFPGDEHRNVVLQVLGLLAAGQDDQAIERLSLFAGRATTATASPEKFVAAVCGDYNSDFMFSLAGLSGDEIRRMVGGDGLTDWMLFLHPEQRRLVEKDYSGPARLIGVSGSGKTSVLIHRANSLAKRYPGERILVLTLNPALAQLLNYLLDTLCGPKVRPHIFVQTLYEYCYHAVKTIAPDRLIEQRDEKSGEDLAACWSDFLERPHADQLVRPIIDVLEARKDKVNGPDYVLDELAWIRSGFGRINRGAYATVDRPGRGIQLPKLQIGGGGNAQAAGGFPADTRSRLLKLLEEYEVYMRDGGLMDQDGVSLEAYSVKERIQQHPELRARCVLVDEVQDCSTVELAVIAHIPTARDNGLFLVGDPVQKVFAKQHDLKRAGIDVIGRGSVLKTNYRNTRQTLQAAFTILDKFRELSPVPLSEVLEPEYAFRDGPRPRLYECASRDEQQRIVLWYLQRMGREQLDGVCVCSHSEASLENLAVAIGAHGIPHYRIRGNSPRNATVEPGVKLALMQDIKGFEFGYVFLTDLMDAYLIPKGMAWEERWRVAFQLYVAMTRARDELVMTFIFNPSILLAPLAETVDEGLASDLLGPVLGTPVGSVT